MALYDGFFDAMKIDLNGGDTPDNYDRAYESGDFTEYFKQFIGSGVCIYNNPDSFKVSYQGGALSIAPGYLFISGFWLKNDADYTVPLAEAGVYAVVARLDTGNRMIKLETEAKAGDYTSENSLVLAFVTVSSGGTAEVEDTRYSEEICSIIDSPGNLSAKIEWAINYIDTEIKAKLDQAEQQIADQTEKLDKKIKEIDEIINTLGPPSVGTIKFSANPDIGDTWLKCDGSFIKESDYPELVEALGKLNPGVEEFKELLEASGGEYMSNCALYDGYVWAYLVGSKKLVRYSIGGGEKKEINVSGVDDLVQLAAVDTVLSICGEAVYLAQNNQNPSVFVLLECANFTGNESSIEMERLDVASKLASNYSTDKIVPKVVDVDGKKYMAFETREYYTPYGTNYKYYGYLNYISWTAGTFESASKTALTLFSQDAGSASNLLDSTEQLIKSYYSFTPKNSKEMLVASGYRAYISTDSQLWFGVGSAIQKIYGTVNDISRYAPITDKTSVPLNIIPIAGGNEYLLRAEIKNQKLEITHGLYNPVGIYSVKTIDIALPPRAALFKESVVYAASQGIWFVFVGTGLLFTENLAEGAWGYLDTQDTIGTITRFGCVDYDDTTNTLYLSGVASNGVPKIGEMKLHNLYDYADDGVWLPVIASDGVPAYIKAVPSENEDEGGDGTEYVDLKINITFQSFFNDYANFLFNDEKLIAGEFTRSVPKNGTFSVGYIVKAEMGTQRHVFVSLDGTKVAESTYGAPVGSKKTESFKVSDYAERGINIIAGM